MKAHKKQRIFSIVAILSLVIILSFIFVACNSKDDQSSEKPDMEATEIYKSVDPSVAFLLVQKKDGSYASGSGFFIDPHGTLVTNYHVIEDGIKCAVQMKNGNTVEVKTVVSYDEDADLAILATKVANTKPITESKSLPQVGETVYAIGYPEAFKLGIASSTFTSGIVSSYRTMDGNEYIQSTVNITHGNSGGVLINKKGDVVGITSSGITYGDIDYMNLSIPISKIHNLAVESNEPLDVVTARHYPVYATFYALDLVFDKQELVYENTAYYPGIVQREGYTFDGWYADKAFTQEWDFSTQITKDTAIFAKLDPIYFSLNLDLNGGVWASNNPGDKYYIKNCEKALPIPKKTGYVFDGWKDSNGNYIDNYPSYSNARTLTLTANWVEGTPGITFQLNDDGTATVTACDKSKSNIVIQATYRGYKVTSIAPSAFKDCKSLQNVTISEHVSNIGSYAFDNCTALKSVVWKPTEKITFGSYVFRNCTNINLIIDDSVTYIADNAFQYQTWFSSITIPDSLTSIDSSAFYESSDLTNVYYTGDIASWCKISGIGSVMSTSTTLYIGGNKVCGDLTIPDGVTSIPACAFYNCSGLTSVTIPDSVTSIGYSAFSGCTGLTGITIPDSVTSIGNSAFYNCISLSTVNWNATACSSAGSYSYPIFKGCSNLTTIYIGNNVTIIPSYAFYNCSELASITIPDGVTSIGERAFSSCTGLTGITIPDSVTSIGNYAFYGCSGLTSITLPFVGASATASNGYNQVFGYIFGYTEKSSGSSAVSGATYQYAGRYEAYYYYIPSSIKSVTITGGEIPYHAFYNCSELASITIPDGVTSIGESAFYNCIKLQDIYITDITAIPSYAFSGCSGLTSITIPDSVTSIDNNAFYGCNGLTSITIPDSVTSIGSSAFSGCYKLVEVYNKSTLSITAGSSSNGYVAYYAKNVYKNEGGSKLTTDENGYVIYTDGDEKILVAYCGTNTELILPSDITKINQYAFSGCSNLMSITIPDSVTSIEQGAFSGCSSLESITIPFVGAKAGVTSSDTYKYPFGYIFGTSSYTGSVATKQYYFGDSTSSTTYDTYYIPSSLKSVTVTGGNILYGAFSNCSGLTSITIPDSVTSIGERAFSRCSGLTSITIPDSVTSIGNGAFYGCSSLTSMTLPFVGASATANKGYNQVFGYIFDYTTTSSNSSTVSEATYQYTEQYIVGYRYEYRYYYYYIPSSIKSVTITGGEIPYHAFSGCSNLMSITIPDGVTSIGAYAFNGCIKLTSIYYAGDIASWCGISGLNNLMSISRALYIGGNKVEGDLVIPDGVTCIGSYSFIGCTGLTSITIPNSVISIGSSAFYNCTGLTSMTIPDSVTSIGDSAFYNCTGLTSIIIPTSVTSIGDHTFYGCSGLMSVTIPDSVTSIGDWAFDGCSGLKTVFYAGTEEQWKAISIVSTNYYLARAKRYYYSEEKPTEKGNYWHYDEDGVTPVIWD